MTSYITNSYRNVEGTIANIANCTRQHYTKRNVIISALACAALGTTYVVNSLTIRSRIINGAIFISCAIAVIGLWRSFHPRNSRFNMNLDTFQQAMGFLDSKDLAASEKVSKDWKMNINTEDQSLWKEQLKAITYGQEAWDDLGYLVSNGEEPPLLKKIKVPPLPEIIDGMPLLEYMKAPDPYFKDGRLRMVSQRFFYVPAGIYASGPLDEPNNLEKLVQHRTEGKPDISTGFACFNPVVLAAHGGTRVAEGYWALMTVDVIDGSREESPAVQEALIRAQPGYEMTELTPASICIFMERIRTGKCIFGQNPWIFTLLKEQVEYNGRMYPVVVGGSGPAGPGVSSYHFDYVEDGASGLRKFFRS